MDDLQHLDGGSCLDGFDFSELDSPDFKEDSVREEIVKPILNALGYEASGKNKIKRSKKLQHPFVKIGSAKRRINIFPDYLLTVGDKYAFVLDAKGVEEEIKKGENVEQVYFYAIHPDIRVRYYALCNGREFIVFPIDSAKPSLYFNVSELKKYWSQLNALLSPAVLEGGSQPNQTLFPSSGFDYTKVIPLPEIKSRKQSAKRHFGVHGYFTKQAWNVVQEYIKNFTQPGDVVLDPFGGSGVTLVEALMLGRKAIHVDLNPLSQFIVTNLIQPLDTSELTQAFARIRKQFQQRFPKTDAEVEQTLQRYPYPMGVPLPRNSDVRNIEELFSKRQLAELALLKSLILKQTNEPVRNTLLLMFSGLVNKVNLTYHSSAGRSEGRGDSSVFRYYRYRIAPHPASLELMKYFESRLKKVIAAKKEMAPLIDEETLRSGRALVMKGSATDLTAVAEETVDYIYTDPPYGAKIPYLDLSVMFNSWLDLPVTEQDYEQEAIEGGEHRKTKEDYARLISESMAQMYRLLKFDRWMSFVFQHKDPAYWHLIVDSAQNVGFEYVSTVTQQVGSASFKKRQNPFTVLHGQLIINFRKTRNPQALMKVTLGVEMTDLVLQTIEAVIAKNQGATLEEIYNELIVRGMELGFLHELSKEQHSIPSLLKENFAFNEKKQTWQIRKNTKFKTQIPLELRIKYYLLSYLRRMSRQGVDSRFDDIVLSIMPLLKNGVTPKHQTILGVLERVAEPVGDGRWRLVEGKQLELTLTLPLPEKKSASGVPVQGVRHRLG